METTAHVKESTQAENISNESVVSKKAVIGFIVGATIVFGCAIYYCLDTGHKMEAAFLLGAYVLVCIYAASIYKSFK